MRHPSWGDVVEMPAESDEKTAETVLRNATVWNRGDGRYRAPTRKE